jgi:hypothetical protein
MMPADCCREKTSVMINPGKNAFELKILGVLCIFTLSGILVAGLWPFHQPRNDVTWLPREGGLRLGRQGTLLSSSAFTTTSSQHEASCSLEIWLQPYRSNAANTFLAFYTPEKPMQFSLHQSGSYLALRSGPPIAHIQARGAAVVYVGEIFRNRTLPLITITSGAQGTRIYVDGALAKTATQFRLSPEDFTGQLVLGTSPVVSDGWSGQLRGLAIYEQELTAAEVARHFVSWTTKGRPDLGQNEHALALYLFDEQQGRTVHDRAGSGIDLQIPERYTILREKFLEPPWQEFYQGWSYWKNVGINIGGFIPLGFFFCAYLTMARQMSRPVLVTIILGAAVSLTIEVLQAYLPTRDSGMTDIITNTLGTGLGVLLYRWQAPLLHKTISRMTFAAIR